jgi:hypothetical protein
MRQNRNKSRRGWPRHLLSATLCLLACAWGVHSSAARAEMVTALEDEVTLTVTNDGFAPAQLTRPAGRFMLAVDNRSDAAELTLRLNGESGGLLREFKVPASALDWSEAVDLTAGQYTLVEVSHPHWVCRIIINNS